MIKSYSPLVWGLGAIAIGLALVIWQSVVLEWVVLFLGVLSLVAGVTRLISFISTKRERALGWADTPLGAVIMVAWGVMLFVQPAIWVNVSMILLGISIVFFALNQLVGLSTYRKNGVKVTGWYYIFPILMLLSGVLSIWNPDFLADVIMIYMGIWIAAYGVVELITYFNFKSKFRGVDTNKKDETK